MNILKNKLIILSIVIVFILLSNSVLALTLSDEISIKSIDQSNYYDSQPYVWGNYIVWRRGVNQNENGKIDLHEPSWIMVHNLETRKTFNITPELTLLYGNNIYNHAQSPHIWNKKIIYEQQLSGNSTDTGLFIYDIKTKETSQIPIPTLNPSGRLHRIYGDWIVYTDQNNDKRQAYIYNYITGVNRVLIGPNDEFSVYGLEMYESKIVFTILNTTHNSTIEYSSDRLNHTTPGNSEEIINYDIWLYDIAYSNFDKIITNSVNITMATSIYQNQIGLTEYNNGNWSVSVYDLNTKNITFTENNAFGILVKYGIIYHKDGNIIFIEPNKEPYVIPSGVNQYVGDKYGKTIVWMNNINSLTKHGDARDSFDIYVLEVITTQQKVFDGLYIVIPVIICSLLVFWFYHERNRGIA